MKRSLVFVLCVQFFLSHGQVSSKAVEEATEAKQEKPSPRSRKNECRDVDCDRGELCRIVDDKAKCECMNDCDPSLDDRFKVCSTNNKTFASSCHLDREFCLCSKRPADCLGGNPTDLELQYYGECRAFQPCDDFEATQFPIRMRTWLFVVMKELARRKELNRKSMRLLKNAEEDPEHSDAAIWKFCDLDRDPTDRHIERSELLYIIQTIRPLEHCLVPFLDGCDKNTDGKIDLTEWGTCLKLDHEKINNKCKNVLG